MRINNVEDLELTRSAGLASLYPAQPRVAVGTATCGLATGAEDVLQALSAETSAFGMQVAVTETGCLGYCQMEPLVDVWVPGKPRYIYREMTAKHAKSLLECMARGEVFTDRALCAMVEEPDLMSGSAHKYPLDEPWANGDVPLMHELPFFAKQTKVALRNAGLIDPESIEEYIGRGGYRGLARALTGMSPEQVVQEVEVSRLRGRGGAGFPTARKWRACREMESDERFVICNADEGDPGAYMDRSLLEGDPHTVVEGMIIGAYAVGAKEGYVYIRDEYPLAVERVRVAIERARQYGLLGSKILGTDFDFDLYVNRGGGAFVCGEETALLKSIAGEAGEPRQRPPYPVEYGLWGKPTIINNVETWANIAPIVCRGAEWFAGTGTENSKGTKVFSLVGKIRNTGLVEVPMGITIREILYDIGGGVPEKRGFKAIQTGGPSGGTLLVESTEGARRRPISSGDGRATVLPESLIDIPVDFESLLEAGSMMGSGGMIVMDEDVCMVDIARYFVSFLQDESCGKCVPCREGIRQMLVILDRICRGEGLEGDIEQMEEICEVMADASLCGLGSTAPNPVRSTIRYFRDEYDAHIREGWCPAGVCTALVNYDIDATVCNGCGACVRVCPAEAVSGEKKRAHRIDDEKCFKCNSCYETCKFDAIRRVPSKQAVLV